jgi:DNA-binding LacI/PurR family transcriptional regulator
MKKEKINILDNDYKKNADVTLADVAKKCGLSHMSVSRALRGAPGVSKANIEQIMAVVKEMGYDPAANHAARRMAMKRYDKTMLNQVIALIFPRELPTTSYFVRIYLGVLDEVEHHKFGLLTHYANNLMEDNSLPPLFMRGEVDGVIILGQNSFSPFVSHIRKVTTISDHPIVSLIEPLPGCSSILTDDFQGGYLAAAHLLDLGHQHIMHSTYKEYPHQQRMLGYKKAFSDRGLNIDKHLHYSYWDNEGVVPPQQVFIDYLKSHPHVTAVMAPNDKTALDMHQALVNAKISVPDEISLIGYDDAMPFIDRKGEYFMTTIALPLEEIGREAVRHLVHQVANKESGNKQIILPVELIIRSTTAPPRK